MDIQPTKTAEELAKEVEIIVKDSQFIVVQNQHDYDEVNIVLKNIKVKFKALEEERKKATIPLDDAKKVIMDWFRKPLERLQLAEKTIKDAILVFYRKEEEKRQAEEKRIRELQEKETERLRRRAEKAEEKGQVEKAEELKEQAIVKEGITPIVERTFEKAKGVSTKTVWHYRIIDINKVPREYLVPNDKMLNDVASATKGMLQVGGVEFYSEQILAVRS